MRKRGVEASRYKDSQEHSRRNTLMKNHLGNPGALQHNADGMLIIILKVIMNIKIRVSMITIIIKE